MANMTFKASLLPNTDLGYSLGSEDKRWLGYVVLKPKGLVDIDLNTLNSTQKTIYYYGSGSNGSTNHPIGNGVQFGLISYASAAGHVTHELSSWYTSTDYGKFIRWYNGLSWSDWEKFLTNKNYSSIIDGRYVLKTGDTMTGNLTTQRGGESYFRAINTATSVGIYLDSDGGGNHGIWSNGYYNGSTFTASGKWIIRRGTDSRNYIDGPLTINNSEDVALNKNGALIIGNASSTNIAIDNDEIEARNNGAASTLYLNNDGGAVESKWIRIIHDSSNNADDAVFYIQNQNNSDWAAKIKIGTYNYGMYISGTGTNLLKVGDNNTLYIGNADAQINGCALKITNNSNTVTIGSLNTGYCHFQNSADIPFYFNKTIWLDGHLYPYGTTNTKTLGSSSKRWQKLYIGTADTYGSTSSPIYWNAGVPAAVNANSTCNAFINALTTGTSTPTDADYYISQYVGGGTTTTTYHRRPHSSLWAYIKGKADGTYVNITGDTMTGSLTLSGGGIAVQQGSIWAGTDGNTSAERQIGVQSGAGRMYMYSVASTTGNRGIYLTAHGSGAAKSVFVADTNNNVTFNGNLNGNAATATTATTASRLTDITTTDKASASATNRRIWFAYDNNTTGRPAYDDNFTYQVSSGTMRVKQIYYLAYGGTYGTGGQGAIWYNGTSGVTQSGESADRLRASRTFQAPKVYGAVWNDYAEYRETKEEIEPGRCVRETGKGDLVLTDARMQEGCEIVSDTFGFAIGESEKCKTPTAATGRVLAYLYEDRELAKPGRPVCSGPDGTVSLMTNEEAREYPWCIIGTVSEIPDYEIWHAGSNGDQEIKVNGRIWIRIR